MDRLHTLSLVTLAALVLCACEEGSQSANHAPAPPARFEAVAAKPKSDPLGDFCDVHHGPGQGPKLTLPATDTGPAATSGSQWLNLWATWCKPCVEELPMIARFQQRLKEDGDTISVNFVSVDTSADAIAKFKKLHPGMPQTMRLTNADELTAYVEGLGLGANAGLPIHVFAGADGHVRCVRSGAVTESHLATIEPLLR